MPALARANEIGTRVAAVGLVMNAVQFGLMYVAFDLGLGATLASLFHALSPVLTAHPTEAKRVTVLEKYRKIYLLLRELEGARWTERERGAILADIRQRGIARILCLGDLVGKGPHSDEAVDCCRAVCAGLS